MIRRNAFAATVFNKPVRCTRWAAAAKLPFAVRRARNRLPPSRKTRRMLDAGSVKLLSGLHGLMTAPHPDRSTGGRRSRPSLSTAETASQRAVLRERLRHHISRLASRATVAELAKPESRTALALRLVLFADALHTSGMLGSVDDLNANSAERHVRSVLKQAFRGDARQVERLLTEATSLSAADQSAICDLLADVGWRLFDGDHPPTAESRAG